MQCRNCEAWIPNTYGSGGKCKACVTERSRRMFVNGPGCVYTSKKVRDRLESTEAYEKRFHRDNRNWEKVEEDLVQAQIRLLKEVAEEQGISLVSGAVKADSGAVEALAREVHERMLQQTEMILEASCRTCQVRKERRTQKCFTCRRYQGKKDSYIPATE